MILGIDPFDQPNVQESKDATRELLDAFRARRPPAGASRRSWPRPALAAVGDASVLGGDAVTWTARCARC